MKKIKEQEIISENWDYLIILDACRYDDFKKIYKKYLKGKLEKRRSKASHTPDWLSRTFLGKYKFTYISSNPHINSRNVGEKWNPTSTFKEVIDAWDFAWDDKLNTVPPKKLVEEAEKHLHKNKLIIHFMQPHNPELTRMEGGWRKEVLNNKIKKPNRSFIKEFLKKHLKLTTRIKIRKYLGMHIDEPYYKAFANGKIEELHKKYKESLENALKQIKKLIEKIPKNKKIVITSDHGDAFGEHGVVGHPPRTYIPELIHVPWLVIEK